MAQDTLEGIIDRWLLEQEIHHRTAEVKKALAGLLEQGLVITRKGRDGCIRYRINQHKMKEIHILLSTGHTHDE
jgi:Fe2+ or Zn2+ uptake regulation protein